MSNKKYTEVPADFQVPQSEKEAYQNDEVLKHFQRLIIHVDMDAYYAQVEMKKHGIPED